MARPVRLIERHNLERMRYTSAGFKLTTSCQFIFTARSRSGTPGHELTASGNILSHCIPSNFPHQHPCKQPHSPPEGGMRKKRLHLICPPLPLCNGWTDFSKKLRHAHIFTAARAATTILPVNRLCVADGLGLKGAELTYVITLMRDQARVRACGIHSVVITPVR
jgi:hypothetical protein